MRHANHLEGQVTPTGQVAVALGPWPIPWRAAVVSSLAVALVAAIHAFTPVPAGSTMLAAGCGIGVAIVLDGVTRRRGADHPARRPDTRPTGRERLVADLHRAVERDELVLHYQPKTELCSGTITGAEALLRWNHPVLGPLQPEEFIPLAEESGTIAELGAWVLEQACRQSQEWEPLVAPDFTMAVNLSPRQFELQQVDELVHATLAATRLPASRLELELTEGHALHEREHVSRSLGRLVDHGIRCSIDDFGTGYSGLRHLGSLPVTGLKIDKSFVQEIRSATDRAPIIRAVIALAADLNLDVVAEGVETTCQLEFLRRAGCHEAQGFHLGRPVPADQFEILLLLDRSRRGRPAADGVAEIA